MKLKKIDLSTPGQKIFAGFIAVGIVFLLLKVLPILVIIGVLGWKAVALLVPLGFIAYNYEIFWDLFKAISMRMTNKIIGYTKIEQHEIYYQHASSELEQIQEGVKKLSASLYRDEESIAKTRKSLRDNSAKALEYDKDPSTKHLATEFSGKAMMDQQELDTVVPDYDNQKLVRDNLAEMADQKTTKVNLLRYTIDKEVKAYERWKEISKVSGLIKNLTDDNSPEAAKFREAQKQTEKAISEYKADYYNTSRQLSPIVEAARADKKIDSAKSEKFLQDLKSKQLEMSQS